MNAENLERYINDHLAGASGALQLLDYLAKKENLRKEPSFFEPLRDQVQSDYDILIDVLDRLGMKRDPVSQAAGKLGMRVGRMKMTWDGMDPGELGAFEALEMLVLGITGKKLLWLALGEIAPFTPRLEGMDFTKLAESAKQQRSRVEDRRLSAARQAFLQK